MNKKKLLRVSGYIFFTLLFYLVSLYTIFPYSALVPFVAGRIKSDSSIQLNISSIRPIFPLGLTAAGVSFVSKKGEELYNLDEVTAEIPFWSLLTIKPKIKYLVKKERSELSGVIQNITEPVLDISLHLDSALIGELFKDINSMPVVFAEGKFLAEGDLRLSRERALKSNSFKDVMEEGKISIKLEAGALTIPGIPLSNLREFSYDHIESELIVGKGILTVDKLDIKGDVDGLIKGKIFIESPLNQSRIDFRLKLKPSENLQKRAGIIMEIIKGRMEQDGYYSLDIKGNFLQPKPII